ncbi:MAG: hypothetical protein ACM34K_01440, partial [Bacillota bacterium]
TLLFGYAVDDVVYYAGNLYKVLDSNENLTILNNLDQPELTITCKTNSPMLKMAEDDKQIKKNKKGR